MRSGQAGQVGAQTFAVEYHVGKFLHGLTPEFLFVVVAGGIMPGQQPAGAATACHLSGLAGCGVVIAARHVEF